MAKTSFSFGALGKFWKINVATSNAVIKLETPERKVLKQKPAKQQHTLKAESEQKVMLEALN